MIEPKDATEYELEEVYGGSLFKILRRERYIRFQQMLLAANMWAKTQLDVNGNNFAAAFWNGEMRRDESGDIHYGIMCIRQDIVEIWNERGVGYKEPYNFEAWLDSNNIAVEKGYLAGFWDGNRTFDGTNWAYNVVCIKEHECVEIKRFVSETKKDELAPSQSDGYPGEFFRKVHRWIGLPDSNGTPSEYVTCLPLFKFEVDEASEGYVSYRLAFR